jgi:hypothetical protein
VWPDSIPNNTYLLNDSKSKMIAYVRAGHTIPFKFKNPIGIETRGRKFVEVPNTFSLDVAEEQHLGRVFKVDGSKGNTYTVTEHNGTWDCTCSGFKFRGKCRHISDVGG